MSTGSYRATVGDVRMEIEADGHPLDAVTDTQIMTVGLAPANLFVTEELADSDMSDDRLELIERYLAGHYILSSGVDELRQADNQTNSDGSQVTYSGDRDHSGYQSTSLGQKAVALDETDTLRDTNDPEASFKAF